MPLTSNDKIRSQATEKLFRVLSPDGGGAKGVY
jgi:hypothetical protein